MVPHYTNFLYLTFPFLSHQTPINRDLGTEHV
jgi:hypothetical protein